MAKKESTQQAAEPVDPAQLSLFQKIGALQASVRAMKKETQAFNYKYVSGDKLLGFVRPKMDELHLLLLPEVVQVHTEPITYPVYDKGAKAVVEKMEILAKVEMLFTWIDTDSGEKFTATWAGTGMNAYDKGYGSALTYAERYYLMKALHIATDEDDVDAIATVRDEAIEQATAERIRTPSQPAPAPAPAPTAQVDDTRRVVLPDDPFIQEVVAWTMRQKDINMAKGRASLQYNWKEDSLKQYIDLVAEAEKFKNELNA